MTNKKLELSLISIVESDYKKPEKTYTLAGNKKYDNVDKVCKEKAYLSQDGNVYVEKNAFSTLFDCKKAEATYIYDNKIPDAEKKNIGGKDVVNSSALLTPLDKFAHEKRDAESSALCKYSRDSLTNIGDSDKAEKLRRQLDTYVNKEQKKLKKERNVEYDEITGESLEKYSAFHHKNQKSIYTDPLKTIDPNEGINVNRDTHQEIHQRGIIDEKQLEEHKEDIKRTMQNKKKKD